MTQFGYLVHFLGTYRLYLKGAVITSKNLRELGWKASEYCDWNNVLEEYSNPVKVITNVTLEIGNNQELFGYDWQSGDALEHCGWIDSYLSESLVCKECSDQINLVGTFSTKARKRLYKCQKALELSMGQPTLPARRK